MGYKILVINPGSTSTKAALYEDGVVTHNLEAEHDHTVLESKKTLEEQLAYRKETIDEALAADNADLTGLSAIACRGGTFGKVKSGAYLVEENLMYQCAHPHVNHASNYGALIGHSYAEEYGCNAYIYDAVCSDEYPEIARITGLKNIRRTDFSHSLNSKAVAYAAAKEQGRSYEDMNIIVAHMGGGYSASMHVKGRVVDSISDDEGAFSLERSGMIATRHIISMCYSGKYTKQEITKATKGGGGVIALLGTKDMREIQARIEAGDEEAKLVTDAMAYHFARDIVGMSAITCGDVDAIVLTGGCAYRKFLTDEITRRVQFIAPVYVYPGAMEMDALANGITRVLDGEEDYHVLTSKESGISI